MSTKKEVVRELLSTFVGAQDIWMANKRDVSRIKKLRPSQLPFCPVGFYVNHATMGMVSTLNFMGTFYTSVGSTVHEVIQKFLSPSGKFLADWYCKPCKKWRRFSTNSECKCGLTMSYHELLIDHKGVVGHIDAVFKDRKGRYWILDYKTCTVSGASYKQKSPGSTYIEQVETYAYMLFKQYGIKVEGVMLMFLPRDNPLTPSVWVKELEALDFKRIGKRIKVQKKMHRQTLDARTLADALALAEYGKCKGEWCSTCRSAQSLVAQLKLAYKRGKAQGYLPLSSLK